MPIDLREYEQLKEKKLKSNKELLGFMTEIEAYTTTELQRFLGIQHPAALQRLKKLKRDGFIELKISGKTHYWKKAKDWPEADDGIPDGPELFNMDRVREIDSYKKSDYQRG